MIVMQVNGLIWTEAGMCGLWDSATFSHVVNYDKWEAEFGEDSLIARHVAAGHFVPLNLESDGSYQVTARVDTALTEREARYLFVASQPYLFVSTGEARLSGVEHIGEDDTGVTLAVPAGRWVATIHIIDWEKEPGAVGKNDQPTPNALPDFVVLLRPEGAGDGPYRTEVTTFNRAE